MNYESLNGHPTALPQRDGRSIRQFQNTESRTDAKLVKIIDISKRFNKFLHKAHFMASIKNKVGLLTQYDIDDNGCSQQRGQGGNRQVDSKTKITHRGKQITQ